MIVLCDEIRRGYLPPWSRTVSAGKADWRTQTTRLRGQRASQVRFAQHRTGRTTDAARRGLVLSFVESSP